MDRGWIRARPASLLRETRGAAIVEFALLAPLLLMILLGILGYGQYFLLAHNAQQIANDAARATLAGMSAAERTALADEAMARELALLPEIDPATVRLTVEEAPPVLTVRVRLDAAAIGLFRVRLLPMPDPVIERRAVIRQGGAL